MKFCFVFTYIIQLHTSPFLHFYCEENDSKKGVCAFDDTICLLYEKVYL